MNRNRKTCAPIPAPVAKPKVWAKMMYRCEMCGENYYIFLENSLERQNGDKHKPVPFTMKCPFCHYGLARDVSGLLPLRAEREVREHELYFKDDPAYDCGVPRLYHSPYLKDDPAYDRVAMRLHRSQ